MSTASVDEIDADLSRSMLFHVFSDEQRRRLAAGAPLITLSRGSVLCQKGDPGDCAYLVLEGALDVRSVSPDGEMVRLRGLGKGEIAGELAVLDGGTRSADMVATRKTRLLRLSRAALMDTLLADPRASVALIEALSQRLRETTEDLEAAQLLDLGGRLARLLIAEAGAQGIVALTQGELAYRVGASREKVNRKLAEWTREGLVAVTKAGIRVLAPAALREFGLDRPR
jgi:CRP-like cAMP-binding protein